MISNKIGICFSTKDRPDLADRTIEPLLRPHDFDLFVVDGSATPEGKAWPFGFHKGHTPCKVVENIRGGADAAIVHNLTFLLERPEEYDYVGLVECDVFLTDTDWFAWTMGLFEKGRLDGLVVGAASARCYADRILVQRKGYALMHNLGAGMVIYTREAARLILQNYRTGYTTDNRAIFSQLSGIDIGRYWAFKGGDHWITADWHFDTILAAHGLAAVALTPSPVEMIGQTPSLEEQGLQIVDREIDEFRNDEAFVTFVHRSILILDGKKTSLNFRRRTDASGEIIFNHQLQELSGDTSGFTLHWNQGFGPFSYVAASNQNGVGGSNANVTIPIFGPCSILVTGGDLPTRFKIEDSYSGFEATPTLQPGVFAAVAVPGTFQYRTVRLTVLDAGGIFHGVHCPRFQPLMLDRGFDYSVLPQV